MTPIPTPSSRWQSPPLPRGAHGTCRVSIAPGGTGVIYTPANGYTGTDTFNYTITDGFGTTATATVNLTVVISLSSIVISPNPSSTTDGGTVNLSATGYDQINNPIVPQPTFTWTILSGGGTITPSGGTNATATYTGGQNTEPVIIQVTSGSITSTATVNVTSSVAPGIVNAANASPAPVTAATTNLSVLASDAAGEPSLTYQWSTIGTPPAGVAFSANNSNAAKNTTATFTQAGAYSFQVKITNPAGHYSLSTASTSR